MNSLTFAPLESDRFGLNVHRGLVAEIDRRALLKHLLAAEVDVAIVRGPAPAALHAMQSYGMETIHADTLVYYECDLRRTAAGSPRCPELNVHEATAADRQEVAALVATTFEGYRCHYHANPFFSPTSILDGYREWAMRHVAGGMPGLATWVARIDGQAVGFACCSDDGEAGEGVLYGVHPDYAGRGLYSDLIFHTKLQFSASGRERMRVSTQVWNYAVQKVWARHGFWLSKSLDTWHVNSLLASGHVLADREVCFSISEVDAFAALSGDINPLHLDTAAARASGFEGRLTHGMLAAAHLSRLFGVESPGAGTLFLGARLTFLKPIYPGRKYRLVAKMTGRAGRQSTLAVARILDADGETRLLAYCDLLKRET